ncbi:MAG: carboxylating nicotinate-nucleotide diphosphorylase [Elusimicrobiaceae bacterium]|nr:carboxylating nicotinate-nucleotide diphosphorylase [Elusimicrobiaceae bacterium]
MIDKIIQLAIEEDMGLGDITSDNIFSEKDKSTAFFIAKEDMIVCGTLVAKEVFEYVDNKIDFKILKTDGMQVKKGQVIAQVKGTTLSILKAERPALNFMQRMSAIATKAGELNKIAKKYGVMLVDTRKSLPGMRKFDKYAVRVGGAKNHRMSLSDGVLIKDNHIAAVGGIRQAVLKIRKAIGHTPKIEVEVKNLKEVKEALLAKADIIMLDNMRPSEIKKMLKVINKQAIVEASGGINQNNLEEYCKTGVDVISMGALTHSIGAKDISLLIK